MSSADVIDFFSRSRLSLEDPPVDSNVSAAKQLSPVEDSTTTTPAKPRRSRKPAAPKTPRKKSEPSAPKTPRKKSAKTLAKEAAEEAARVAAAEKQAAQELAQARWRVFTVAMTCAIAVAIPSASVGMSALTGFLIRTLLAAEILAPEVLGLTIFGAVIATAFLSVSIPHLARATRTVTGACWRNAITTAIGFDCVIVFAELFHTLIPESGHIPTVILIAGWAFSAALNIVAFFKEKAAMEKELANEAANVGPLPINAKSWRIVFE